MTRKGQAENGARRRTGLRRGRRSGRRHWSWWSPPRSLARIALRFSSFEYFWLASLGLTSAALVSSDDRARGVASLLFGLFIATIGLDVTSGLPRFNFGNVELMGGVSFIPAR